MAGNTVQTADGSQSPLSVKDINSIDEQLDLLLAVDIRTDADAIARIQTLVYHILKRVSKDHGRLAEKNRQEQI